MKEVKTRKINIKFEKAKELINLYLGKNVNWPRELKIGYKLLSQFPEIEFWREFSLGVVKFDSLCVFLNEIHNKRLQDEYQLYLAAKSMNKKETFILNSAPIIEIRNTKKKPKNILEFVDN